MSAELYQRPVGQLRTLLGYLVTHPGAYASTLGSTVRVLGVQTVFSAYYMTAISEWGNRYE